MMTDNIVEYLTWDEFLNSGNIKNINNTKIYVSDIKKYFELVDNKWQEIET